VCVYSVWLVWNTERIFTVMSDISCYVRRQPCPKYLDTWPGLTEEALQRGGGGGGVHAFGPPTPLLSGTILPCASNSHLKNLQTVRLEGVIKWMTGSLSVRWQCRVTTALWARWLQSEQGTTLIRARKDLFTLMDVVRSSCHWRQLIWWLMNGGYERRWKVAVVA
jgi:hypothetical protein